jgi:hypothetical protein
LGTVAEQPDGVGSAVNVSGVNASTKACDRSIRRPLVHINPLDGVGQLFGAQHRGRQL